MKDYPLTEIEADIKPEDFQADSLWYELVKYCGPASVVILAKYRAKVGERLFIRQHSGFVRKANNRKFERETEGFVSCETARETIQ